MISPSGEPSDDPRLLSEDQKGALLPVGGLDHGHKGFALALLVEMLTSGLPGFGRADRPDRWGAGVFVMVIDPERYGGRDAFVRQTGYLAAAARAAAVPLGAPPVRLPGERALAMRREQLRHGVQLTPEALARLQACLPSERITAN